MTLLQPDSASHDHVDWFLDRFAEAFRDELIDFVDCVREGASPAPAVRMATVPCRSPSPPAARIANGAQSPSTR